MMLESVHESACELSVCIQLSVTLAVCSTVANKHTYVRIKLHKYHVNYYVMPDAYKYQKYVCTLTLC